MSNGVCFVGGTRHSRPLDATMEKKFRALAGLGSVCVVGFSADARPRRFTQHARFYLLPHLPLPLLRYAEMFLLGPWAALWCVLQHGARILVAQSPYEGFAAAWAKLLARLLGRRVALVVESHGDFEAWVFLQRHVLLPGLYRWLMRRCARFSLDRADLLRAVSAATEQQLKRWAPGKAVFRFPAWTDIETFLRAGAEREMGCSGEILFAGPLAEGKGVHHLANAFGQVCGDFPQAQLVICGREADKGYAQRLRAQARQTGLNGRVHFLGQLPQAELAARMRRACVLVLPSISEGLGRVVLEAMAAGTPVVGSCSGGIPELIREGQTGFLVPPGDEAALAGRLRWVLSHPADARAMGCNARAAAASLFSTEMYLAGYQKIFHAAESLLANEELRHASSAL